MVAYFFVTQLSLGSVCYLYRLHVFCKIKKIKDHRYYILFQLLA